MKKTLLSLSSLFTLASITLITPGQAGENPELLAKYDFEGIPAWIPNWGAGYQNSYKPATGWKTPFKVSLCPENPHSGDNALRIDLHESADGEKIVHSPAITISAPEEGAPPRKVTIRAFVRTAELEEGGAGIRILERDEKGASLRLLEGEKSIIPIPESPEWSELTAEGTLHSQTRSLSFMVVVYQPHAPATVWVDDVSIELLPAEAL